MMRRFLLVSILCGSVSLFAQKGGGGSAGGGVGSAGSTGGTSGGTATSGPAGTPGTTASGGIPTTAGTVGGLSGQAASGPISSPSGNTGIPTVQQTMGGPAGTTGTNQGDLNNLNTNPAFVNNGGFVSTGTGQGGVLLSTPTLSFPSPVPTAGISDAGRAGISSNTSLGGATQGIGETVLPNGMIVNPAALNGSGRLITDVGPSEFIGAVNQGAPAPSLAEVAAQFKTHQTSQNARTITNADVQRLVGSNTNAQPTTMAGNMPPSGMPIPAQAQASGTQQSTTSSTSTSASSPAPAQQQSAAPQSATNQNGSSAQSTENASSSTTPRVNQRQSGSSENNHLPATSTVLPLLGLLGVASSGVGLWYRKYRK